MVQKRFFKLHGLLCLLLVLLLLPTGASPQAQPAIEYPQPFALREDRDVCAVERAILRGLERRDS